MRNKFFTSVILGPFILIMSIYAMETRLSTQAEIQDVPSAILIPHQGSTPPPLANQNSRVERTYREQEWYLRRQRSDRFRYRAAICMSMSAAAATLGLVIFAWTTYGDNPKFNQ